MPNLIPFPSNPNIGQVFTYAGRSWIYTSINTWDSVGTPAVIGPSGPAGRDGDRYATTSTSTIDLDSPNISFTITVDTGLAYSLGQDIIVTNTLDRFIIGEVSSYNPITGSLSFNEISR